jgi:hemerythrin-like domain-containing protein
MPELLDTLHGDHERIASTLALLEREIQRFEAGAHPDYDLIEAAVDYFSYMPDRWHHPVEELIAARLAARDPKWSGQYAALGDSHARLADNLHAFHRGLREVLADAELPRADLVRQARNFIDLQRGHLAMEEAEFFPAAERVLTEADWDELAGAASALPRTISPTVAMLPDLEGGSLEAL